MNLKCNDIGLNLVLSDILVEKLYSIGIKHYPREFGGLLIGHYSEDMKTCYITETILPKKYKSSKYSFERGKEGLEEKLQEFYDKEPKLIYIGEWHTHPDNLPIPSSTDIKALELIANHDDVVIKNPVGLIMGLNTKNYEIGLYIHFKNKLYRYE